MNSSNVSADPERGERHDARRRAVRWMALSLALLPAGLASAASPAPSVDEAYADYRKGRFAESQVEYSELAKQRPEDARLRFNAGAAAYRQNDLTNAARWFESVVSAPDLRLQQQAYYNLGNTRYRLGEALQDPQGRQRLWQDALTNFSAASKLDVADTNAAGNLAFIRQKLVELQQQMPPPQQQQQPSDQQKDKDKNQDQKQDPQQNQQSKDQSSSKDGESQDKSEGKQDSSKDQTGDGSDSDSSGSDPSKDKSKDQQGAESKDRTGESQQGQGTDGESKEGRDGKSAGSTPEGAAEAQEGDPLAAGEKAGEMTQAQAVQVLENQKGDEKALMLRSYGGGREAERAARVRKPW